MGDAQKREKIYKSPRRKLVRFFEKSRNQWKEKCREAKAGIRVLSNRVRFLEKGRERLKNQMRELRAELARMKSEERKREKEYEILKKKTEEFGPSVAAPPGILQAHKRRRSGCGSSITRFRPERRSAW